MTLATKNTLRKAEGDSTMTMAGGYSDERPPTEDEVEFLTGPGVLRALAAAKDDQGRSFDDVEETVPLASSAPASAPSPGWRHNRPFLAVLTLVALVAMAAADPLLVFGAPPPSTPDAPAGGSQDDREDERLLLQGFRDRLGTVGLDLYEEAAARRKDGQVTIDVGSYADFVGEVVDAVGVVGLMDDVLNTYQIAASLRSGLRERRWLPDKMNLSIEDGHQGPSIRLFGNPLDQDKEDKLRVVFWIRHWAGAILAEKLLREGGLRRSFEDDEVLDVGAFMEVVASLTSERKYPDIMPYHAVHGFWWQYLVEVRLEFDEYPTDLFEVLCAPWLDEFDYNEHVKNSMFRECRHGVGHGVFYSLALRDDINGDGPNVRLQKLERTYLQTDEQFCEGRRICDTAPEESPEEGGVEHNAMKECWDGFAHSTKIFDPDHSADPDWQGWAGERADRTCEK